MLHRTTVAALRVLCLTMLPDGGALSPALGQLGYTPYTLRSTYQQGHASSHPMEWSKLLNGETDSLPQAVLADYDAVVGPPGAMVYDILLRQAPGYTKVILVEEVDKETWARKYDAYQARLRHSTRRASRNRITRAFENMLAKMVVSGVEGPAGDIGRGDTTAAAADAASDTRTGAAAIETSSAPLKSHRMHMTSSSSELRRAFAAEALKTHTEPTAAATAPINCNDGCSEAPESVTTCEVTERIAPHHLTHPRAVALQQYEESVKVSLAPSTLLVYRYGDGWEPLCAFLEKPVPASPFPEYDDGLRVLGSLQERIDRAYALQYLLGILCAMYLLVMLLPYCGGAVRFLRELYRDYQIAFGNDGDTRENEVAVTAAEHSPSEAERFEAVWRKRGGSVTRT